MVVQNSVTFSVTRIGSQVARSRALNYIWTVQHLLVSSVKMARHTSSIHHNWSLLKPDRFLPPTRTHLTYLSLVGIPVSLVGFAGH